MGIINTYISKINIDKKSDVRGGCEVKQNLSLKNISKPKIGEKISKNILGLNFNFEIKYGEDAKLEIGCYVLYKDTEEIIKECYEEYEKNKKLIEQISIPINNYVYQKLIVKCFTLTDMVNLPSPIPLPKFSKKKEIKK